MSAPSATSTSTSRAAQYVIEKGWSRRDSGDHLLLEYCPVAGCGGFHFYLRITGDDKDGLWDCKKCGAKGNLYQLSQAQGDRLPPKKEAVENVSSMQDWAATMDGTAPKQEPLPQPMPCHRALLADPEAMDYLIAERGFSMATIERMKLGITKRYMKKSEKEIKVLVIPYLSADGKRLLYAKYRSLPPEPKSFGNSHGWDVPLFNVGAVKQGMEDLWVVEGEMNAIALINIGIENVIAVPGANSAKALWLTIIDNAKPKNIYLLYDNDAHHKDGKNIGQLAAKAMAQKLITGGHNVLNVVLPEFILDADDNGDPIYGKDINEWLRDGGTREALEALKLDAKPFDVDGVVSVATAMEVLEHKLRTGGVKPRYDFAWPSVSKKAGGAEPGDVIDFIAKGKIGKTTAALNQLEYIRSKHRENVFMFCLEMPPDRLVRKLVSHITNTDDSYPQNDEDAKLKTEAMLAAIPLAKEKVKESTGDFLFGECVLHKGEEQKVFDMIRQVVRRYNVKWVCFDNLQMLCDLTLKGQNNRTVHLSQLSKAFKALAMELKIVLIRVIQPNRVKDGNIVDAENADGASQIEKDCDLMLAFHRNKKMNLKESDIEKLGGFIDEEETFAPEMNVKVALSRYSGGGVTTVMMDGATSTVKEFSMEARLAATAPPQLGTVAVVEA